MRGRIVTDKVRVSTFVSQRIEVNPRWRDPDTFSVIGWERDGEIVAAVLFDQFYHPSICGHVASDGTKRWATREFLFAIFDYPFRQLACERITAPVAKGNAPAIRFLEKLGFTREGCLRRAMPDGSDRLLFGLLKEDCKWI